MVDLTSNFGKVVQQHLKDQYVIWLTTVDSTLTPQPRPVWFIYQEDSFLIFSQAKAHKVAHIKKNPKVLYISTRMKLEISMSSFLPVKHPSTQIALRLITCPPISKNTRMASLAWK